MSCDGRPKLAGGLGCWLCLVKFSRSVRVLRESTFASLTFPPLVQRGTPITALGIVGVFGCSPSAPSSV